MILSLTPIASHSRGGLYTIKLYSREQTDAFLLPFFLVPIFFPDPVVLHSVKKHKNNKLPRARASTYAIHRMSDLKYTVIKIKKKTNKG